MTRTRKMVTALPGLLTIVALLVGGPFALVWWAGFPLPRHNPSADQWSGWLDHPLTKTSLIDTVAVILWIGWALILYVALAACVAAVAKVRLPMPRLAVPLHTALAGLVGAGVVAANTGAASAATAVVTVHTPTPRPLAAVVAGSGRDLPRTMSSGPQPSTTDESQILATGVDGQITVTVKAAGQQYSVTVHRHDTLWKLAGTWLGDPTRWQEIYHLNRAHYDQHGQMHHGNLILPGWVLQLPDDATPPAGAHPLPAPRVASPTPATTEPRPVMTIPTPAVATSSSPVSRTAAPEKPPTKSAHRSTDAGDEVGIYAGLAGAGLLSALLLAAVRRRRRRQQQHRRPQRRLPHPREGVTERALRVVEQPADIDRLDVALRALATGLADHDQNDLPDIVGAWIVGGNVNVLLSTPCPHAPAPWIDGGSQWMLPASAELTDVDGGVAPLPTLVTVGSRPGRHLLLDLERAGSLSLSGDALQARSLLRYLASELACNNWSDDVEVTLAGFDPDEAELLAALNPDRVRAVSTVGQAVTQLRRRVATATSTLRHVGAQDALAGRIGDLAGDAWMPQVLLSADPDEVDVVALRLLASDLAATGRCGVAVATNGPALLDASDRTNLQVSVAADGTLRVVGSLDISATAAGLPVEELEPLAEIMRQAREIADVAIPAAPETEVWATGTDAAGALLELFESTPPIEEALTTEPVSAPPAPVISIDPWLAELAAEERPQRRAAAGGGITAIPSLTFAGTRRPVTAAIRQRRREADPHLDRDLKAWTENDPGVVRVGILGPVTVAAPGDEPVERRRFLAEIIVFLAQRGARGATGDRLTDALWPEGNVKDASRRVAITRSRRWLGNTPTGDPWLPDMGADRTYRLEEGYLLDWHLFRRLRTRGEAHGPAGIRDLRAALGLVRGAPLDGADRAYAVGSRNPYTWLPESDIYPGHIVSAIVDTAHELAELYLEAGATTEARWAVHRAWLADPYRGDDEPWCDIMRAEHMDAHNAQLRRLLGELMQARDAEVPEDLSRDTYTWLRTVIPDVLGASTSS
jgi:hypothetical protein